MKCTRPVLERCKVGPVEVVERPCGVCPSCRANLAQSWTYRLFAESKLHKNSVFVTLTYNEESIKSLKLSPTGIYSLDKDAIPAYMKRLRDRVDKPVRYYGVGEYGEHTKRPHYHVIIFGLSDSDSLSIEKAWPYGFVKVGTVTPSSLAYVARYCVKKLFNEPLDYLEEGVVPEFSRQSNRPGIGFNAIKKCVRRSSDGSMFVWFNGRRQAVPKYFKDKIRSSFEVYSSRLRAQNDRDEQARTMDTDSLLARRKERQYEENIIAKRKARAKC